MLFYTPNYPFDITVNTTFIHCHWVIWKINRMKQEYECVNQSVIKLSITLHFYCKFVSKHQKDYNITEDTKASRIIKPMPQFYLFITKS